MVHSLHIPLLILFNTFFFSLSLFLSFPLYTSITVHTSSLPILFSFHVTFWPFFHRRPNFSQSTVNQLHMFPSFSLLLNHHAVLGNYSSLYSLCHRFPLYNLRDASVSSAYHYLCSLFHTVFFIIFNPFVLCINPHQHYTLVLILHIVFMMPIFHLPISPLSPPFSLSITLCHHDLTYLHEYHFPYFFFDSFLSFT